MVEKLMLKNKRRRFQNLNHKLALLSLSRPRRQRLLLSRFNNLRLSRKSRRMLKRKKKKLLLNKSLILKLKLPNLKKRSKCSLK
jgi:hypothetical protein